MSFNIYIKDCEGNQIEVWQTPTSITFEILENAKGDSNKKKDLSALALFEKWVLENCGPKPLKGKDARNPYLINEFNDSVKYIKVKFEHIREEINKNNNKDRLVDYI